LPKVKTAYNKYPAMGLEVLLIGDKYSFRKMFST
jgi:hypothetical protein